MIAEIEVMCDMGVGERMLPIPIGCNPNESELCIPVQDFPAGTRCRKSGGGVIEALFMTETEGLDIGLPVGRSFVPGHGEKTWTTAAPNLHAGVIFRFALIARGSAVLSVSP